MNSAISSMLQKYDCQTRQDYENALKEIIQEVALLGLWRGKFFEHAAFYGGTALRILYGLDRFSEDMDFSLLQPNDEFKFAPYLASIGTELAAFDLDVEISEQHKNIETAIDSAFIKADTKEHLLKIDVPQEIAQRIHRNERMKIKLEIDTNPPPGFETESKLLLLPIPFSVKTYKQPDLFAGKIHAIIARAWQPGRVKGRDFYDFVWYLARSIPVRIIHVEQRLRQTETWTSSRPMSREDLLQLLQDKFETVDFELAKNDVRPFLRDPSAVALWSKEFFVDLLPRLLVV